MDQFDSVQPKRIIGEVRFETPVKNPVLPIRNVGKLVGLNPSVQNIEVALTDGTVGATMRNAMDGQTVQVLGDGVGSIVCVTGTVVVPADTITSFTYISGDWYINN